MCLSNSIVLSRRHRRYVGLCTCTSGGVIGHRRHFYPVGFRCTSRHRRGDNLAPSAGGRERRHKARPKTWRTRETCRARSMNANGVSGMKFAPGRLGKELTESRLTARRCIFEGCCSGVGGVDDTGVLSIPLGRLTGRHGSCSSVLSRRNALYDAPRVIIKHCSRTARQCATSQSSEERRKLAKQSRRQLNRALLAREPKPASSGAVWQCSTAHALSLAEPQKPSRSVIAPVVRPASMQRVGKSYQEELCDDVDWRSPFQD